jgi:hypothetical protein
MMKFSYPLPSVSEKARELIFYDDSTLNSFKSINLCTKAFSGQLTSHGKGQWKFTAKQVKIQGIVIEKCREFTVKSQEIHDVVQHLLLYLCRDHTGQLKQTSCKWL